MRIAAILLACVLWLTALPVRAWDDTGHKVVARIAWARMTPAARAAAVRLLQRASPPSGLPQLYAPGGAADSVRALQFFMRAASWADVVRSDQHPERRDRYHRGPWHYTNYFWEEANGQVRERTDLAPEPENIVERLEVLSGQLGDARLPQAQRALALAWILHLVGDVHQPLHTSARVTPQEPDGDRGGNLFRLDGSYNLHGYWDSILSRSYDRRPGEGEVAYIGRIAEAVMAEHPPAGFRDEIAPDAYAAWARAGFETATADVYRPELARGVAPPAAYQAHARQIAEPAVARAGYRLAELLNRLLG